jgi:Flp pilus assembly protein TadD
MSKQKNNFVKYLINEQIKLIDDHNPENDLLTNINKQIKQTNASNTNLLQEIHPGIHLLTISKPHIVDPLRIKRLSDRVQYSLLPNNNDKSFCKLSLSQLRNHGHIITPSLGSHANNFMKNRLACRLVFFYELGHLEQMLLDHLAHTTIVINEVLTNRVVVLTDGIYTYPLSLSKLIASTIWLNLPLAQVIDKELVAINHKFRLYRDLFTALRHRYADVEWTLENGTVQATERGVTRTFDYASLLDDVIFAHYEKRMDEYLNHFRLSDLDTMSSFPTVAIRSLVHLKARPYSLSRIENGYAIAAATEGAGKQTPISFKERVPVHTFSLWMHRALRHLFRHQYRARVVFLPEDKHFAFSLVGEQVATIALFPALVKGVFESLNLETPQSVRLIAHNEDVLTIAHDTASWVDINAVNQRATSLFRLVANDGADPLSLFEQVLLPGVGVGTFHLRVVPDSFFELIETAQTMRLSLPPGQDHYLLGLAYECLHEWGLAVSEFQRALRFDAHDPEVLHALGCALMEIGQIKESLPFLKRAFELMPEDPEVANNWGLSNMECGYLSDAIRAFERAVRLSPGSADYLKNLGHGYLLAARPRDALLELNKAIKCDPHSAEAHASLAHLYLASGDESRAKEHAMLAYNENPVDANIANMLWHLTLGKK